jgi:hypothetical protein
MPRPEGGLTGDGSRGFDDTLTACLTISLLQQNGDYIALHPGLPDTARDRRLRDEPLPSLVRGLVLSPAVNEGLWNSSEGARDLTRALAWFLAQDTLQPPGPWNDPDGVDVAQERQFASSERVFSNDTRWGSFDRWVPFLGFGRHLPRDGKDVLIPDPTDAIRGPVASILTSHRRPIGALITELAHQMPVVDGGTYRREVEARMKPQAVRSAADLLSPSLAHALLRLRDERVIILEDLADAPLKMRVPAPFGPERTITHASLARAKTRAIR